jgi:hypothetical protein
MIAEPFAQVPVQPQVVEVIVALERAVILADPVFLFRHERLEDRGGDFRVVVGAQRIADVVQQRHDDIAFPAPVAVSARGGLQAVLEAIDRKPAEIAVEQPEVVSTRSAR